MTHQSKPGTIQFALDLPLEPKLRFETLHESLGFKTKVQTFQAILYFVSTKDKIDPATLQRVEKKIDHSIQLLESLTMKNGQIFAHKSTARGGLDLEYLDETSRRKVSLRERADMDQQIGKKLKHFTDYASKERSDRSTPTDSCITAFGSIRTGRARRQPNSLMRSASIALPKPGKDIWQSSLRPRNVP